MRRLSYAPRRYQHEGRNVIAHADNSRVFAFPAAGLVLALLSTTIAFRPARITGV